MMLSQITPWISSRLKYAAAAIALVVVALLHSLLAQQLTVSGLVEEATGTDFFDADANRWITAIEWAVLGGFLVFWAMGRERVMGRIILGYACYVTLSLAASELGLVFTLTDRKTPDAGFDLLWDAFVVWTINVLIFGVWYWLLDGRRENVDSQTRRDFLFPQQANQLPGWHDWQPTWADYLFLAFTHSTAFSPTDTAALSRRAKFLIMIQSSLSLVTLAMIAARAINVIN